MTDRFSTTVSADLTYRPYPTYREIYDIWFGPQVTHAADRPVERVSHQRGEWIAHREWIEETKIKMEERIF